MERFFSKLANNNPFLNLIILGRPWNGFLIGLFSVLGFLFFSEFNFVLCLSLFFTFFFEYFAGAILNDLEDISTDSVNTPFLPLEKGVVSKTQALFMAIFFYVLSLVLAFSTSTYLFVFAIIFFVCSILYSVKPFRFVARGFLGNFTLSVVTILLPSFAGGFLANDSLSYAFVLVFFAFTLFFSFFSITKDFKDITGDSKTGKNTVAIKLGIKRASMLAMAGCFFSFIVFCYHLFFYFNQNYFFLFTSLIFLGAILFFQIKSFKEKSDSLDFEQIFALTRGFIFIYSIALFIYFIML